MRKYPLFIIDTSRQHSRGIGIDYLQCTAHDCPFVAEVSIIDRSEYTEVRNVNVIQIFSEERNEIRLRIKIIDYPEQADNTRLQSLLRKAMKEVLERRKGRSVDVSNINRGDMLHFLNVLHEQSCESLSVNPKDSVLITSRNILSAIIDELTD